MFEQDILSEDRSILKRSGLNRDSDSGDLSFNFYPLSKGFSQHESSSASASHMTDRNITKVLSSLRSAVESRE